LRVEFKEKTFVFRLLWLHPSIGPRHSLEVSECQAADTKYLAKLKKVGYSSLIIEANNYACMSSTKSYRQATGERWRILAAQKQSTTISCKDPEASKSGLERLMSYVLGTSMKWKIAFLLLSMSLGCQQRRFNRNEQQRDLPQPPSPVEDIPQSSERLPDAPQPISPPLFADCLQDPSRPLVAELFQLPVGTQQLPDFKLLQPLRKVCLAQLNITDRDFEEGFPGIVDLLEWFALQIRFRLTVPAPGVEAFTLVSDDGSQLWINGELWIDNDGQHPVRERGSTRSLPAGDHEIEIRYFQGPKFRIALELFWQLSGQTQRSYIPSAWMRRL
jgi:hypothetical protein